MTLTIKLIRDVIVVLQGPKYWVRRSNSSVVRALTDTHTQTERQMDWTDSITSTADAGGKNVKGGSQKVMRQCCMEENLCNFG